MLVEVRKLNKKEKIVVSSRDVAETFGKPHKEVLYAIEGRTAITERAGGEETKHKGILQDLIEGGEHHLENYFILSKYESRGKNYREYLMTRDGFVLLVMGFSGEKAMRFKVAYINQFNQMESVLQGKLIEREKGIVVRQAFTKALQNSGENERMHGNGYSNYTDHIVYKQVFGMRAKELREKYVIGKKDNLRDCFTQEELRQVQNAEMLVSSLMEYGWGFNEIKDFVLNKANKMIEG